MKKVLIWDCFPLENVGGPSGYLYNLHEYLKRESNAQIMFLSDLILREGRGNESQLERDLSQKSESKGRIEKIRKMPIMGELFRALEFVWLRYRFPYKGQYINLDLDQFDYIHFHYTYDLTRFLASFKNYKGKTILTSHSPCPITDELLPRYSKWIRLLRPLAFYQECRGFRKADYVMFPCKDAREPYEKERVLKKILHDKEDNIFYVASSIMDIPINYDNMQKYSELGIPNDAYVITYFGRHNSIKGYDILKKIGQCLLDKYSNLYFVCAGKGELSGLTHPRWKELGFIKNTHELLYQADMYIVPNRETYFDLVVLEILRSGTLVALSKTGGNKYFMDLSGDDLKGIKFFDYHNLDEILNIIEESISQKNSEQECFETNKLANRKLYEKMFTMRPYVDRYIDAINNI